MVDFRGFVLEFVTMLILYLTALLTIGIQDVSSCKSKQSSPVKVNKQPTITCHNPTDTTITAPPRKTSVQVHWKLPEAHDPEDGVLTVNKVFGKSSGSSFGFGNHVARYSTEDSSGLTISCLVAFYVKVVRCKHLSWPSKGRVHCDSDDLLGSTCTFSCDTGHALSGSRTRVCQIDGKFNGSEAKCTPKSCPELHLPENGERIICSTENSYTYRTFCQLKCKRKRGYAAARGEFAMCSSDGTWTNPILTCEDVQPPKFENCPNSVIVKYLEKNQKEAVVKWPQLIVRDNSGRHEQIERRLGLPSGSGFKKGTTTIWYDVKDHNGNRAEPCVFVVKIIEVECPVPDFNGKYLSIEGSCAAPFKVGKTCQLTCRFNVQLNASSSYITCQNQGDGSMEGYWDWGQGTGKAKTNVHKPFCNVRKCPDLAVPDNGALACDLWVAGKFCQIQCQEGYDIPESSDFVRMYVCGETDASWQPTSQIPNCSLSYDAEGMYMKHSFYYYEGDCQSKETQKIIRENMLQALQHSHWSIVCDERCLASNVEVVCGKRVKRSSWRRRRLTPRIIVSITLRVNNSNHATQDNLQRLNQLSSALKLSAEAGQFMLDIGGRHIKPRVRAFKPMPICRPGTKRGQYVQLGCVACPRGSFYNTKRDECLACPRGQYQQNTGQMACETCPHGQTTVTLQAVNKSECLDFCAMGHYSPNGVVPCSPCPRGKYQPDLNSKQCISCPIGKTTLDSGSASSNLCIGHDIMLQGYLDEELVATVTSDLTEFSFVTWIKVGYESVDGVTFVVTDPFHRKTLSIKISDHVIVTISNTSSSLYDGSMSTEVWYHVGVVYSHNILTIYQNGVQVNRHLIPPSSAVIPRGSTLRVQLASHSDIFMRGMQLMPFTLGKQRMSKLKQSCDETILKSATFAYYHLKADTSTHINELAPSTCLKDDPCKSKTNPCGEHVCISRHDGPKCRCLKGYSGPQCRHPPNSCDVTTCQNNGTCIETETSHVCQCLPQFKGLHCQEEIVDGGWGNWTGWSDCSVTCGHGMRLRKRSCDSPLPDPEGKVCEGANRESMACTEEKCPRCRQSDLIPGNGVITRCTETSVGVSCTISCQPGLIFAQEPTEYNCREGQWFPSLKTIPCTDAYSPLKLGIKFIVTYNIELNQSVSVFLDHVKETVLSAGSSVPCTVSGKCQVDTLAISDCQATPLTADCVEEKDDVRAVMTVVTDVPEGIIDLSFVKQLNNPYADLLLQTWTQFESQYSATNRTRRSHSIIESLRREKLTKQLAIILNKWGMLEESHLGVESNDYKAFDLHLDLKTTVQPSFLVARQYMKCPSGSVQGGVYCVKCPPGTWFTDTGCEMCRTGFYQDESGMTKCKPCPGFTFTLFKGSSSSTECLQDEEMRGSTAIITDRSTSLYKLNLETLTLQHMKHSSVVAIADYDFTNKQTYFLSDAKLWATKSGGSKDISKIYDFEEGFMATGLSGDFRIGLIFYISNNVLGVIQQSSQNHTHRANLTTDLPDGSRDLITDPTHTRLYWVSKRNIITSLYDGTALRTVYIDKYWVGQVTLDFSEQNIYWSSNNILKRIHVDGTGFFSFTHIKSRMIGLTTHYFFFVDTIGSLTRINKDGSGQTPVQKIGVNTGIMKTYTRLITGQSVCGLKNGGCSQICLPVAMTTVRCVCDVNHVLLLNNVTCRHEMSEVFDTPVTEKWVHLGYGRFALGHQTHLIFSVKACDSARLALFQDTSNRYEIHLGEHHGNVSSVRKCQQSWKVCVTLKETTEIQLSCSEFVTFKVEWGTHDGVILSILRDGGFRKVMSAKDKEPLKVKFIAIATGKKVIGNWKI